MKARKYAKRILEEYIIENYDQTLMWKNAIVYGLANKNTYVSKEIIKGLESLILSCIKLGDMNAEFDRFITSLILYLDH